MQTLRLLKSGSGSGGHDGDVFACSYTPDGQFVLSAGWDGYLRLWEAERGAPVSELRAGSKPLSACAVAPDGKRWLSGSMDGLLARWDAATQHQVSMFLAHTRPISCITFAADGDQMATASWDRRVHLWKTGQERDSRHLEGHTDIVAGCRFTPNGQTLVSWSYDGTVRLWEAARCRQVGELQGHADRITTGAVCPDGRWIASGARDRVLKLWDLAAGQEVCSVELDAEVRSCFFLLNLESLVSVDGNGRLLLHSLPDLEVRSELATRLSVQSADLAPSGSQLALGCADGRVYFVAVDGFDSTSLLVTPTQTSRRTANVLQRLFGTSRLHHTYRFTCPACRYTFELAHTAPGQPAPCPSCHRNLRIGSHMKIAKEEAAGT